MSILFGSAIPFPDVYSKGILRDVHKKTRARIFIAAMFFTEKNWKTPQRPSINKETQCTIYVNSIHLLKRTTQNYIYKSQKHVLTSTSGYDAVVDANLSSGGWGRGEEK